MKFGLLHLSDIHLKDQKNFIQGKEESLCNAIANLDSEIKEIIIIISGDIAYSGKLKEFDIADNILRNLKSILTLRKFNVNIILIPGNHDCNFENIDKDERGKIVKDIVEEKTAINLNLINEVSSPLKNFFDFRRRFHKKDCQEKCNNKLFTIYNLPINDKNIIFYLYNSAWISQMKEIPGQMMFPIKSIGKNYFDGKADLFVSLIHHPLNWLEPNNRRILKKHLETTSDIILTGHEHIPDSSINFDSSKNYIEYVEGAALQDDYVEKERIDTEIRSGFNFIILDLEHYTQKNIFFNWKESLYVGSNLEVDWSELHRSKNLKTKYFKLVPDFEKFINDPGASFVHPKKSELQLKDIFVYPHVNNVKMYYEEDKSIVKRITKSEEELDLTQKNFKKVLLGEERMGKTSICKMIFKNCFEKNFIPIFIEGDEIRSYDMSNFKKLVDKNYKKQYGEDLFQEFSQLTLEKVFIIIDDFDKVRLNASRKMVLLQNLQELYSNIVLTCGNSFLIKEILSNQERRKILENFDQFQIMEFGHELRSQLVMQWYWIGQENHAEEIEIVRAHDLAINTIDTIIGKNFVPSVPFFIITILQTIETSEHILKASSYGYYYEFLITKAISKISVKHEEIDAYFTYIIELANYFFENNISNIDEKTFKEFHKRHCTEYQISASFEDISEKLKVAEILRESENVFYFKYKYIYYYFEAKYISNNIYTDSIKDRISLLTDKLFLEENSNIIMFLTHLSKDPYILSQILKKAKTIFNEIDSIKLENDIEEINSLLENVPALVYKNKDYKKERQMKLRLKDDNESLNDIDDIDGTDDIDHVNNEEELESEKGLDFISQTNLAFKVIDILGQIMKNHFGSLKGTDKEELAKESYEIGLRALHKFYSIMPGEALEFIVVTILNRIKENVFNDKTKLEDITKKIIFRLFSLFGSSYIKRISESIGASTLKETFDQILIKNNVSSYSLIDIAIKLDYDANIPHQDIEKAKAKLSKSYLPYDILRNLVINHLYMFPVSYQEKQRICNLLGISIEDQLLIDNTSVQKKIK